MDGEAIGLALATTAGPDCLRDVIPKYGLRLKVYRAIKDTLMQQVCMYVGNYGLTFQCLLLSE